jgi:hypothetical protein
MEDAMAKQFTERIDLFNIQHLKTGNLVVGCHSYGFVSEWI